MFYKPKIGDEIKVGQKVYIRHSSGFSDQSDQEGVIESFKYGFDGKVTSQKNNEEFYFFVSFSGKSNVYRLDDLYFYKETKTPVNPNYTKYRAKENIDLNLQKYCTCKSENCPDFIPKGTVILNNGKESAGLILPYNNLWQSNILSCYFEEIVEEGSVLGRYIKALVDTPDGGIVLSGEIGIVTEVNPTNPSIPSEVNFPSQQTSYCINSEKYLAGGIYLLMPKDYKPEKKYRYKGGDYIVCLPKANPNPNGTGSHNGGAGFKANWCFKVRSTDDSRNYQILWKVKGDNGIYCNSVRLATPEEIKKYDSLGEPYDTSKKIESPKKPDIRRFRVGDKVKAIGATFGWGSVSRGGIGIIREVFTDSSKTHYSVDFPKQSWWSANDADLELVEEKWVPQVGDWVIGWHNNQSSEELHKKAWQIAEINGKYVVPKGLPAYSTGLEDIRLANGAEIHLAQQSGILIPKMIKDYPIITKIAELTGEKAELFMPKIAPNYFFTKPVKKNKEVKQTKQKQKVKLIIN